MDGLKRNRELTETRVIQALREELATAERWAEEERIAHNATEMAAVEREVELEHRAVEASNALARIQVVSVFKLYSHQCRCDISRSALAEFGNLRSVQVTDISNNNLSGYLPQELGQLQNLDNLECLCSRWWAEGIEDRRGQAGRLRAALLQAQQPQNASIL